MEERVCIGAIIIAVSILMLLFVSALPFVLIVMLSLTTTIMVILLVVGAHRSSTRCVWCGRGAGDTRPWCGRCHSVHVGASWAGMVMYAIVTSDSPVATLQTKQRDTDNFIAIEISKYNPSKHLVLLLALATEPIQILTADPGLRIFTHRSSLRKMWFSPEGISFDTVFKNVLDADGHIRLHLEEDTPRSFATDLFCTGFRRAAAKTPVAMVTEIDKAVVAGS